MVVDCALFMGNQARVEPHSTVLFTSTCHFPSLPFPNRLNDAENVYLYSSEVPKYSNFDPMHGFKKAQQQAKANIIPALNIASSQTCVLKPV